MIYRVPGPLDAGSSWEDFLSDEGPCATICVEGSEDTPAIPAGQEFAAEMAPDGWYSCTVRGELTEATARRVLAAINQVEPEVIEIRDA